MTKPTYTGKWIVTFETGPAYEITLDEYFTLFNSIEIAPLELIACLHHQGYFRANTHMRENLLKFHVDEEKIV